MKAHVICCQEEGFRVDRYPMTDFVCGGVQPAFNCSPCRGTRLITHNTT